MTNPKYFDLLINKIAWGLLTLGSGPLIIFKLLVTLGLWPDKNSDPVGVGILAVFTFWPAVILIAIGTVIWAWKNHFRS